MGQERRRVDRPGILVITSCALIPISLVILSTFGLGIPPRQILGDPSTFTEQPFYLGLFSDLGFVGWCTAAVAGLLAASVTMDVRYRRALFLGGLLSAVLCLDDLMLLHETFGEKFFFPFYVVTAAFYLWNERALHREVGVSLLVVALALLATSLGIDAVDDFFAKHTSFFEHAARSWFNVDLTTFVSGRAPSVDDVRSAANVDPTNMAFTDLRRIAEDGAKFAGIVSWAVYHVYFARYCLIREPGHERGPRP